MIVAPLQKSNRARPVSRCTLPLSNRSPCDRSLIPHFAWDAYASLAIAGESLFRCDWVSGKGRKMKSDAAVARITPAIASPRCDGRNCDVVVCTAPATKESLVLDSDSTGHPCSLISPVTSRRSLNCCTRSVEFVSSQLSNSRSSALIASSKYSVVRRRNSSLFTRWIPPCPALLFFFRYIAQV